MEETKRDRDVIQNTDVNMEETNREISYTEHRS